MGMSRRQYAAHRGVSHTAVGKAISSGRITLEADGSIDPVTADRQWDAQTDPAKQRGAHARALGTATAAGTARASAATRPVPRAAIESVGETLREAGADPDPGAGGEVSFLRARMANEVLKAQTARVRLEKMKGELVDRARATNAVSHKALRQPSPDRRSERSISAAYHEA